jgi:UDP-glucose:glycoprotein glucosyltransferase
MVSMSSKSDAAVGMMNVPVPSRGTSYELLNSETGVLEIGSIKDAAFQVVLTLDPLSETAQKWSSILKVTLLESI